MVEAGPEARTRHLSGCGSVLITSCAIVHAAGENRSSHDCFAMRHVQRHLLESGHFAAVRLGAERDQCSHGDNRLDFHAWFSSARPGTLRIWTGVTGPGSSNRFEDEHFLFEELRRV